MITSSPTQDQDTATLLDFLTAMHTAQLVLCDRLDAFGSALGDGIDANSCLLLARALAPTIDRAHAAEEEVVFPFLARRWAHVPGMAETLERLKLEHIEDTCFSEGASSVLLAYGRGENGPAPEATALMLRSFAESLRRHVAFEREMIVPLLELDCVRVVH